MNTQLLEEIGLTKGEIAVYLSLLELGSSTVGPLVKQSNISSSKIYYVLDRLIDKGLASFVIRENTKHFEAAPPRHILKHLQEKRSTLERQEQEIEKILPELELKRKLQAEPTNVNIYKGNKGARTVFRDIVDTLEKGDELLIMGAFEFDPEFRRIVSNMHRNRSRKGISLRVLINKHADEVGRMFEEFPLTTVKYMQRGVATPAIFLIYGEYTLISLPNSRTFLQIASGEATKAFRTYFESIWKQQTYTFEGKQGVVDLCEMVLEEGKDLYLLGANGSIMKTHSTYFRSWNKRRVANSIAYHMLATQKMKGSKFVSLEHTEVRYLDKQFESPMVIWIFGNKVAQVMWDQMIITLTDNAKLADDYRKYFALMWKSSK